MEWTHSVYKYELHPTPGDDGYVEWVGFVESMCGQRAVLGTWVFGPECTYRLQLGVITKAIVEDLTRGYHKV